jgi:hypothetical protein
MTNDERRMTKEVRNPNDESSPPTVLFGAELGAPSLQEFSANSEAEMASRSGTGFQPVSWQLALRIKPSASLNAQRDRQDACPTTVRRPPIPEFGFSAFRASGFVILLSFVIRVEKTS